MIEFANYFLH